MLRSRSLYGVVVVVLAGGSLLLGPSVAQAKSDPDAPPSPGRRVACCLLARHQMWPLSAILEPGPDTYRHIYGAGGLVPADKVGLMYTCLGGVIDFGHLRSIGDLTKFYYDTLSARHRAGEVIEPPAGKALGRVTLTKDLPASKVLAVARSIAYAESVFHEIESYYQTTFFNRNSSFSPEDLVTNFTATYIAGKAITDASGGVDYNSRFSHQLEATMNQLGVVDADTTRDALNRIEGTWVKGFQLNSRAYLRRRNFNVSPVRPWLVDGLKPCADSKATFPLARTPGFAIPADTESFFTVDYPVSSRSRGNDKIRSSVVTLREFPALIKEIQDRARQEYGPDYDKPGPVGHVAS